MKKKPDTKTEVQPEPALSVADTEALRTAQVRSQLLPADVVEPESLDVPLVELANCKLVGPEPEKVMLDSIRAHGMLNPITLVKTVNGYEVAAGRRRLKAARILELETVPARVYPEGWANSSTIAIQENAARRANPISDYLAIREMIDSGCTVKEITSTVGLPPSILKRRLKFDELLPELLELAKESKFSASVAEVLATLPASLQEKAVLVYKDRGKLTAQDVDELRQVKRAGAVAALGDDLFSDNTLSPVVGARLHISAAMSLLSGYPKLVDELQGILETL